MIWYPLGISSAVLLNISGLMAFTTSYTYSPDFFISSFSSFFSAGFSSALFSNFSPLASVPLGVEGCVIEAWVFSTYVLAIVTLAPTSTGSATFGAILFSGAFATGLSFLRDATEAAMSATCFCKPVCASILDFTNDNRDAISEL